MEIRPAISIGIIIVFVFLLLYFPLLSSISLPLFLYHCRKDLYIRDSFYFSLPCSRPLFLSLFPPSLSLPLAFAYHAIARKGLHSILSASNLTHFATFLHLHMHHLNCIEC